VRNSTEIKWSERKRIKEIKSMQQDCKCGSSGKPLLCKHKALSSNPSFITKIIKPQFHYKNKKKVNSRQAGPSLKKWTLMLGLGT
jgi:hypothetical protein